MNSLPIVIVIAPQGAGKTRAAKALARRFGCTHIVDAWNGVAVLQPGALALSNLSVAEVEQAAREAG